MAKLWVLRALVAAQCVLAVLGVRQWLYASTYRLYLEPQAVPGAPPSASRQRFEIVANRVEPQILSDANDRLFFPIEIPAPSELHVRAVPTGAASFEIAAIEDGQRRVLSRQSLTQPAEIVQPLPPLSGALELSNQGEVQWHDPRVVRDKSGWPKALGLMALLGATLALRTAWPASARPSDPRRRTLLCATLMAGLTALTCVLLLEAGLRVMGSRLPDWIAVERRDLGERQRDPRWQDSPRYGSRLAPNVRTFCEWEHGDIVRMGFLPPDLVRHPPYRFAFATDADGFRNAAAPAQTEEIAALGDSFTDAMTLPAELAWPSQLSRRLGIGVRNFGTAGFGPQQELLALRDYVLPRHPRLVVVAFFAGNDLQDAERFANLEREGRHPSSMAGWPFKRVIARFDELYVTSLAHGLADLWRNAQDSTAAAAPMATTDFSGENPDAPVTPTPSFDRGLFTLPVAGRSLRFAFLPAYLNGLRYSADELRRSRRFELTREAYSQMHAALAAQGSELVVMFIPSKAQVYLPLLAPTFPSAERDAALRAALQDEAEAPSYATLMRNRLALNRVMRDFCADAGIPFLDLTPALEARVRTGSNVYFPDDSHWNATGHNVASASLENWLETRGRLASLR